MPQLPRLEKSATGMALQSGTTSNRVGRDLLFGVLLFLFTLTVFSLHWRDMLDIGEATIPADRILQYGEVPYRDFWTLRMPGQFYLLAAVFNFFGSHLFVEAVATSIVCALAVAGCYWFVRTITGRWALGLGAACMLEAVISQSRYYFVHFDGYAPAILCTFAAWICYACYLKNGKTSYLVAAGLLTGAIVNFDHKACAYTVLALTAGLLVKTYAARERSPEELRPLGQEILYLYASILLCAAPIVIYIAVVAGPDAWADIIVLPATKMLHLHAYPGLLPQVPLEFSTAAVDGLTDYLKYMLPFLIQLASTATIVIAIRRKDAFLAAISAALWVAFWLHYAGAHTELNTNIMTMTAYAVASGALLYLALEGPGRHRPRTALLAGLLVFVWFMALSVRTGYWIVRSQTRTVALTIPRLSGLHATPEDAAKLESLARFVEAHISPNEYLYIGNHRHDAIVFNDTLAYYIANRPIAVRYHELPPGLADVAEGQREMIASLESKQPQYIILKHIYDDGTMNRVLADFRTRMPEIGAQDLDKYIESHYEKTESFGPFDAWKRKAKP